MNKLIVLGTGETTSITCEEIKKNNYGTKILAFQRAFPNCYLEHGTIPDYWFSADPFPWLGGLEFLDKQVEEEKNKFKSMKILIPDFTTKDFNYFRQFSGTTPLSRTPLGWERYINLLKKLKKEKFNIEIVKSLTTKYIKNYNLYDGYDLFEKDSYMRFMSECPIFGTVPYDSDGVHGTMFKWGLESKLSSHVFPIAYYLGYKTVLISGFDFKGGRFYDKNNTRHPWNDESQIEKSFEVPFGAVRQWVKWKEIHDMNFYNINDPKLTLLGNLLEYKSLMEICEK